MQKPPNSPCTTCPLAADETCTGFSNNEGTGRIPLMFVGEALGANELTAGLPFRPEAQAGSRLEAAIRRIGRDRQDFTLTNIVRGRPHNNKLAGTSYEQTAIQNCRPYLIQTIEKAKPRVIVALGDIAYRALTGLYGRNTAISKVRGYFIWSKEFNCYVLPTFHPSFVVRGGDKLLPVLMADIKKALEVAEGVREVPALGTYTTVSQSSDLFEFLNNIRSNQDLLIAYDIETSMSSHGTDEDQLLSIMRKDDDYTKVLGSINGEILDESANNLEGEEDESGHAPAREPTISIGLDQVFAEYRNSEIESIQFSLAPGTGIFIPYTREFIPIIAEILASPNPKAGHNSFIFDNPILRRNGFQINGTIDDTLWMWHHSQPDQPASLQYVSSFFDSYGPWKHLSASEPELYGCLDVDAVQHIMSRLPNDLRATGLYNSYEKFVRDFHPILERMQDRGMRIDLERRDIFEVEVELATDEIDKTILANVPSELHGMHPPDGIKQWNGDLKRIRDEVMAEANSLIPKKKDWVKKFSDLHPVYQTRIQQRVTEELGDDYKWAEFSLPTGDIELRPYKVKLFNPNSTQQLMEYMKLRGIPIPKSLDGKATTGKKELERVAKSTKDIVLTNILELRKQRKVVSTYVQGWQVGGDSAVHTTFTFAPATWQLSSRNPNIQNCFPGRVEILTKRGWVKFYDLSILDEVAQYELSGDISFVKPLEIINQKFSGDLVNIQTEEQIDITMTPEHECLLRHRKTGEFIKVAAANYKEDYQQMQAGYYVGGDLTYSQSQLILCAAFQADGSVTKEKAISWTFMKKRKIERLSEALATLNIPYRVYKMKSGKTQLYVWRDDVPSWLEDKKFFGPWLLDLDKTSFEFMANEIYFWDGSHDRLSMYSSSISTNTDWAQILAILSGRRAKVREYHNGNPNSVLNYQTDVAIKPYSLTTNRVITKQWHSGQVYCVTVPSGNLVVRQNGKVVITGNCPKHGEFAQKFRQCIVASPGCVLLEFDYKSFHMLTLGFCAGDAKYMRMARLDGHSYTASHLLKIPEAVSGKLDQMSDEEFKDYIKWFKSDSARKFVRDKKAKPTILGYGFGLGARKLYDMNIESFANQKEAQGVIDMLDRLFPLASKFREEIKQKAHRQRYLISPWGAIRRFNSVFVRDAKYGGWKGGDDAERAIAFLPANCAFGKIREAMIHLAEEGLDEKYRMTNTVHDSLVFDCPLEFRDEAIYKIKEIMERPGSVLIHPQVAPNGLSCEVEVSEGENWGNIVEVKL